MTKTCLFISFISCSLYQELSKTYFKFSVRQLLAKLRAFECRHLSRVRKKGAWPLGVKKIFKKIFFEIFQNLGPDGGCNPNFTKIDDIVVSKCKIILGFVLELPSSDLGRDGE